MEAPRWRWLPAIDSWKYHLLLGAIGILILGPLGGVTASYMNFSLGFFVGGRAQETRVFAVLRCSRKLKERD